MDIAIAFFDREQYAKLYTVCEDKGNLYAKYDDWLANVKSATLKLKAKGFTVHRQYIEVDRLITWAKRQGLALDGSARSQYAQQLFSGKLSVPDV